MPEVQHQTEEQRTWLLAEYPVSRLYQLKRKCNGCQEQDLSLLEGELVALLEDTDPLGSSSRWLVHTGGKCVFVHVFEYKGASHSRANYQLILTEIQDELSYQTGSPAE